MPYAINPGDPTTGIELQHLSAETFLTLQNQYYNLICTYAV